MEHIVVTPLGSRWLVVLEGHFTDVHAFVSLLDSKLGSRLQHSTIESSSDFEEEADEDEIDLVQATLQVLVKEGNELDELKKLLKSETYKWITVINEGEELKNDNGDILPIA